MRTLRARTADGLELAVDVRGDERSRHAIIFAHGGGQTRHAWDVTARAVADAGWTAYTFDLRGHGDSERAPDGCYSLDGFVTDVATVSALVAGDAPVLVGASLGGIASLLYCGERHGAARALALVDIGVRSRDEGVARIIAFMRRHVDGFASLEEAAAAVAAYAPRRGERTRPEGLRKNLRRDDDGRYRWHWDPALLGTFDTEDVTRNERLDAALRGLTIPMTVIRGAHSDVLDAEAAAETAHLGGGTVTTVGAAAHMVAGDANDAFSDALFAFLEQRASARVR